MGIWYIFWKIKVAKIISDKIRPLTSIMVYALWTKFSYHLSVGYVWKIQSLTSAAFPLYSLKWLQAFRFTAIALYKRGEMHLNIKLVWFVFSFEYFNLLINTAVNFLGVTCQDSVVNTLLRLPKSKKINTLIKIIL